MCEDGRPPSFRYDLWWSEKPAAWLRARLWWWRDGRRQALARLAGRDEGALAGCRAEAVLPPHPAGVGHCVAHRVEWELTARLPKLATALHTLTGPQAEAVRAVASQLLEIVTSGRCDPRDLLIVGGDELSIEWVLQGRRVTLIFEANGATEWIFTEAADGLKQRAGDATDLDLEQLAAAMAPPA
jgi:hypothetical protein